MVEERTSRQSLVLVPLPTCWLCCGSGLPMFVLLCKPSRVGISATVFAAQRITLDNPSKSLHVWSALLLLLYLIGSKPLPSLDLEAPSPLFACVQRGTGACAWCWAVVLLEVAFFSLSFLRRVLRYAPPFNLAPWNFVRMCLELCLFHSLFWYQLEHFSLFSLCVYFNSSKVSLKVGKGKALQSEFEPSKSRRRSTPDSGRMDHCVRENTVAFCQLLKN